MTNEDFIARTRIELSTIYKKINDYDGRIHTCDMQRPDACRLQIAFGIIREAINILESQDVESIRNVAEMLDLIAEDCTYLAEGLDKQ